MDSLYHTLGGIIGVMVIAYSLKLIASTPFVRRLLWSTYLVAFLIYFREVTQFQTKNFESNIFKGWNPWSVDFPWSQGKQLETFVPIALSLVLAYAVAWYYRKYK